MLRSLSVASSPVTMQKPAFVPPVIHDNPDGWGPSASDIPEKFQDLPYAPFSKSDKLGRCADWTGQQQYAARGSTAFYPQDFLMLF